MIQLFPQTTTTTAADSPAEAATGREGASTDGPMVVDPRSAVELEERPPHADRPWVYTNMIASADGGTAVDGLSGGLGGPGDQAVFGALRSMADVIIAGSATVTQERYRAPDPTDETRRRRRERGQADRPRIAVVSARLGLDLTLPLFTEPDHRAIVIAPESAPTDLLARIEPVADLLLAGDGTVDLAAALAGLSGQGVGTVLCEGGPSLNGQFVAADLVDEWNLTLSPHLLAGDSKRAAVGPLPAGPPPGMRLRRVWNEGDHLFCRWVRQR